MRHCCLSLLSGALEEEGWRDAGKERWKKDKEERREFRDRLIYEFLFLNRVVFGDLAETSQSGVHTYTPRTRSRSRRTAACACATSHPTGKTLKVVDHSRRGSLFMFEVMVSVSVRILLSVADGEINEQSSPSNTVWNLDWKQSTAISTDWDRSLGGVEEEKQRWRERLQREGDETWRGGTTGFGWSRDSQLLGFDGSDRR